MRSPPAWLRWVFRAPRRLYDAGWGGLLGHRFLLLRHTGRRPSKRAMERIRFYLMGYATLDELTGFLGIDKKPV